MEKSPEQYREQAARMRELAANARDPDVVESYSLMALDWERLAIDAERLEQRRIRPKNLNGRVDSPQPKLG